MAKLSDEQAGRVLQTGTSPFSKRSYRLCESASTEGHMLVQVWSKHYQKWINVARGEKSEVAYTYHQLTH